MQIGEGMVSHTYLQNGIISKQYLTPFHKYVTRNIEWHWKNEIKALELLKGEKHFPQLVSVDHANKIIYMSYCGDPLTKKNLPKDWKKQCAEIENALYKHDIYLQDLTEIVKDKQVHKNILVKDGVIYVIDFGIWHNEHSESFHTVTAVIEWIA